MINNNIYLLDEYDNNYIITFNTTIGSLNKVYKITLTHNKDIDELTNEISKLYKLLEDKNKKIFELDNLLLENKNNYDVYKKELINFINNKQLYILGERYSNTSYKEYILDCLKYDNIDLLYKWYNKYINNKLENCEIYLDIGTIDPRFPKEYYKPKYINLQQNEKYKLFLLMYNLFNSKNIKIIL